MKKIVFSLLIMFTFFLTFVQGATIYGTIYDLSLNKVNNVIVEVNSDPRQRIVALDGTYELEIPIGQYKIEASYQNNGDMMKTEENITVIDDGIYILDLFLYPYFDEEDLFEGLELDIDNPYADKKEFSMVWLLAPLAILMFVFLIILVKVNTRILKKEVEEEMHMIDDDLKKIMKLIRKNKGRLTQKEIRKEFPLSEAKVSLMIAELESLGKIKKIKKGRGNIILLKKKK